MQPTVEPFNEGRVLQALDAMPQVHKIAFAASCCERIAPAFSAYAVVIGLESPNLVESALDEVWLSLNSDSASQERSQPLIDALHSIIPKIQGDGFFLTPLAFNSVSALIYTLECSKDGQVKWPGLVARLSVECVDTYLHFVNDVLISSATPVPADPSTVRKQHIQFENWIGNAPLMQNELEAQQRDLNMLGKANKLTAHFLEEMRGSSRRRGLQPLNRGLIWMPE